MRNCKQCGIDISSKSKSALYCTKKCRSKANWKDYSSSLTDEQWRVRCTRNKNVGGARHLLTDNEYNELFSNQEGKCSICKTHVSELKRGLVVDHNHSTGDVRGLLCNLCNIGIGMLKDDANLLNSAIKYLTK